jgi:cytoskeletal protein CcmA (bactofilin family)
MAAKSENGTELNLITAGTVFEGKLRTPGSIRVDGKVVGEITATQNVSLGNAGDIDGNVSAKNVTIGGKMKGMIFAQEKLVLEAKAVVRGDIRSARLVIDEGAVFDGKCMMAEAKPALPQPGQKPDAAQPDQR